MNRIFLGPPLHWLLLAVIVGLGWYSGIGRSHVSQFNLFLVLLLAVVVAILIVVLKTSPQGTQITRDPLEDTPLDHTSLEEARLDDQDDPAASRE